MGSKSACGQGTGKVATSATPPANLPRVRVPPSRQPREGARQIPYNGFRLSRYLAQTRRGTSSQQVAALTKPTPNFVEDLAIYPFAREVEDGPRSNAATRAVLLNNDKVIEYSLRQLSLEKFTGVRVNKSKLNLRTHYYFPASLQIIARRKSELAPITTFIAWKPRTVGAPTQNLPITAQTKTIMPTTARTDDNAFTDSLPSL